MPRPYLTLLLALTALSGAAADAPYAVSAIPAKLLENAHAVKRVEEERYEVVSATEAYLHKKIAVTIFDESGKQAGSFAEYYDVFRKIQSVEGALYDAQGKLQRRLKSKEVVDQSAVSDISLMDDNRIKSHSFTYPGYPYTVEYEVHIRYNNSFFFPSWVPQEREYLSVEKSSFTFVAPAGYAYRFKGFNYPGAPTETNDKGRSERTWTVSGLPALVRPFGSPLWNQLTPMIFFGANDFSIDNYTGNARDWQAFGLFQAQLLRARDVLPEAVKQKVQALIAGVTDPGEKVRRLYAYLQANSRYISIQLGIGGWQPFEARFVAEKGYGDCKALSNFMFSLLKEAGIRSHYTLVNAGDNPDDRFLTEDFASLQFNHAILCVPLEKDSIWLECTSQTAPAGYMGAFTGNRKALLITENGGQLVSTPRYGWKENQQLRQATGTIDATGNLKLQTRTRFRAEQQDDLFGLIKGLSPDRLRKYLGEHLGLPGTWDLGNFQYTPKPGALPELDEELDLLLYNYATLSGKRLFITPNIANRSNTRIGDESRTQDILLDARYEDVDSVTLQIPEGYSVEVLPEPVSMNTPYGMYQSRTTISGNVLRYVRTRRSFGGRFPVDQWEEIRKFYNSVYKADRQQVVLVKGS